jgi:hypothetical protein
LVCREDWSAAKLPSAKELSMLATARRVLQVITGRRRAPALDASLGKLPSVRRRRAWAESVQRLLDGASRSSSGVQFPHLAWEAPPFGGDPLAARRAAEQLQYSFTGHPEP